jgi:hypothetical protein
VSEVLRILSIIVLILTANVSWALEWNVCHKELESLRKSSADEISADYLAAASNQAVKLRDLYEDIQAQRFTYDRCKYSVDGTQYCVYTQGKLNAMLGEYQAGRKDFNNMMTSGKYSPSKSEACGFILSQN